MAENSANTDLLGLTAEIVSAHVSNNPVSISDLPNLIQEVYRTLNTMGQPVVAVAEKPQPAVPVKKSITPEYLICLEDGKKLKMLKRHLKTAFNLTPDQYREKWGLPPDYPMVAPNYTKHRSSLAKRIGLGTKPRGRPPGRGGRWWPRAGKAMESRRRPRRRAGRRTLSPAWTGPPPATSMPRRTPRPAPTPPGSSGSASSAA